MEQGPKHVAIIMDGNGRWAQSRGMARHLGHAYGIKALKETLLTAKECKVEILTIFAFSSENWKRSELEVSTLFDLFANHIEQEALEFKKQGVRVNVIGSRERIDKSLQDKIDLIEEITRDNNKLMLNIAFNYGGRWDIVNAVKKIIEKKLKTEEINEDSFASFLSIAKMPEPDLLIRTGFEQRLSNFLLWDLAYTEFYFSKVFWPDFGAKEFIQALNSYKLRARRYGNAMDAKIINLKEHKEEVC